MLPKGMHGILGHILRVDSAKCENIQGHEIGKVALDKVKDGMTKRLEVMKMIPVYMKRLAKTKTLSCLVE